MKMFFFGPQLLLAAFAWRLWALRDHVYAPQGSPVRLRYLVEFVVFLLAACFVLLAWLNKPQDYVHLAVLYWPLIVLGLFFAQGTLSGRPRRLLVAGAVAALPLVLMVAYSARLVGNLRAEHSVLLTHERAGVRVKPAEAQMMEGVLAYLAAHTAPDDRVAGLPYFPLANFLGERQGPHRSAYIVWPFPETADRDQAVVEAMEATGTDVVLYNFTQFFSFDPVWEHAPLLFDYLVENFEIDEIFSFDVAGYKPAALRRQVADDQPGEKSLLPEGIRSLPVRVDGPGGPPRVIPPESRDQYIQEMPWPFRPAVALRPSSRERQTVLAVPVNVPAGGASLRTAVAVHPRRWFKLPASWVDFRMVVRTPEEAQTVFERRLHPTNRLEDRGWFEVDVDLGPWAGQALTLEFSTGAENVHGTSLWSAGWARPRLLGAEDGVGDPGGPG